MVCILLDSEGIMWRNSLRLHKMKIDLYVIFLPPSKLLKTTINIFKM